MTKKKTKALERMLPKDVAEKYKVVTIRAGKYNFYGFGEIDLRTISLKKADELFEKEFPYLELMEQPEQEEPNNEIVPS